MARAPVLMSFLLALLLVFQISFTVAAPLPPRQAPAGTEAAKPATINILSIIPSQGEPGTTVTLYGLGFTPDITVFLGNSELPAAVSSPKQLSFDLPRLEPGLYALYLRRDDGTTSKPYNFNVLAMKPIATSLSPDTIYSCASGRDREVTISGRNFREGSQVLFDGAAVRSRLSSSETISFTAPQVADGFHQVQVRNPEDTFSGVLGLVVDGRPEITGVSQGEETVNQYNLIIDGRNFQQNSALMVMEERTYETNGSALGVDTRRVTSLSANAVEREQMVFLNCNRIIYRRYPYSTTPKNLRIQVINLSTGSESSVFSISAP